MTNCLCETDWTLPQALRNTPEYLNRSTKKNDYNKKKRKTFWTRYGYSKQQGLSNVVALINILIKKANCSVVSE